MVVGEGADSEYPEYALAARLAAYESCSESAAVDPSSRSPSLPARPLLRSLPVRPMLRSLPARPLGGGVRLSLGGGLRDFDFGLLDFGLRAEDFGERRSEEGRAEPLLLRRGLEARRAPMPSIPSVGGGAEAAGDLTEDSPGRGGARRADPTAVGAAGGLFPRISLFSWA